MRPERRLRAVGAAFVAILIGSLALARSLPRSDGITELVKLAQADHFEAIPVNPQFPVPTTWGKIDGVPAGRNAMQRYARLFAREFGLYPVDLIKRSELKRVVFCEQLSFDGQLRAAVPDFEHDTLYLDVTRGGYDRGYLREVLHHEFYHIIDFKDDGQLYTDDVWTALNARGFKYGTGGKNAQNSPEMGVLTDRYPGFLDHYCTTGVEEDKAEVFAYLMVNPAYVKKRCEKDAVLAAKVKRMRELMVSFCPQIDDQFWAGIEKLRGSEQPAEHTPAMEHSTSRPSTRPMLH
jgi:hypothetical protein